MSERFHRITAEGIELVLDLAVGHVRNLTIDQAGLLLTPLHTAPWVEDPAITEDPDIAPNLKYLSGDFFCAPFGKSDVVPGPPHGWPANSSWTLVDEERTAAGVMARFVLEKPVMGARLTKEITLRNREPFVYQRHVFTGGSGAVPVASHAMTRFAGKGRLSFSPKRFAALPDDVQESDPERGRSVFAHGLRFDDLGRLPLADGTTVDLRDYPVADGHEDFVTLVEAKGSPLGWAAAVRPDAGDIVLSLKNPAELPTTGLWYSNGGRFYPPWNGRHRGVLGIEEARAYSAHGHAAAIAPNPFSDEGIPTALVLDPDGSASVRHVVGGIPRPATWREVAAVEVIAGRLRLIGDDGEQAEYPFDSAFLAAAAA